MDGEPAGYAVYFFSYSTWQAKKGLYLEDLYISPRQRGGGAGKLMLRRLAQLAVEQGCGRFLNGACWTGTSRPSISTCPSAPSRRRNGCATGWTAPPSPTSPPAKSAQ
ncbi:GNAT family N-acetyltransferase [Chromobacterium haemolyticum]|nr:GNAT family N-acetyltransferase [Chromobacterium haemolyticum]